MWCRTCQQDVASRADVRDRSLRCPRCADRLDRSTAPNQANSFGTQAAFVDSDSLGSAHKSPAFIVVNGVRYRVDAAHPETAQPDGQTQFDEQTVDVMGLGENASDRSAMASSNRRLDAAELDELSNDLSASVALAWGICIAVALMSLVSLFGLASGQTAQALGLLLTLLVVGGLAIGYWAVARHRDIKQARQKKLRRQNTTNDARQMNRYS